MSGNEQFGNSEQLELYCFVNGKWVAFSKLPCSRCPFRYAIGCPICKWNEHGQYNTYSGKVMTAEEARELNERNNENE